jgi:galactokinase
VAQQKTESVNNTIALLDPYIKNSTIIVRSPGRINLIGEHTDYNDGFVLPAAIDKAAYIALTPRADNKINLHAIDLDEHYETTTNDIHISNLSWPNYILGVVDQYQKKGIVINGFDAALMADVPIGAGLSSSAAVECATAMALNEYLQTSFDKFNMVKMAQKAEHEFAHVQCGIMDQFASMFGKKNSAIKLDCRSLDYEYVPLNMKGIKIVLFDSGVKHSLASTEYNTRRQQCEEGVSILKNYYRGIKNLRDVTIEMLDKYVAEKNTLIYQRCKYVVEENKRLLEACENLKNDDINNFGKKMFASHEGLSQQYEVSCDELDFLVDKVKNNNAVLGARMMGGGFGGCTINLVKEEFIEELKEKITEIYYKYTNKELKTYIAQIEDGTSVIQSPKY